MESFFNDSCDDCPLKNGLNFGGNGSNYSFRIDDEGELYYETLAPFGYMGGRASAKALEIDHPGLVDAIRKCEGHSTQIREIKRKGLLGIMGFSQKHTQIEYSSVQNEQLVEIMVDMRDPNLGGMAI